MFPPQILIKQFMHIFIGRILNHPDLLQNHASLPLHIVGIELRMKKDVGKDLKTLFHMGFQDLRVETGVFPSGKGVDDTPNSIDLFGDIQGAALFRSLEKHMFDKVGQTVFFRRLIPRPGTHPEPNTNRWNLFQRFHKKLNGIIQEYPVNLRDRSH